MTLPQGAVRLATASATTEDDSPSPFERALHFVTDPQVAILLFSLGTYGLIFELSNPSLIFPGVIGVLAILLALFAFGTLDANAAGIGMLLFAVLLFLSEIWVPSHGILTAGGVAATIIGAVILFPQGRPTLPGIQLAIPPPTIAAIAGVSLVFFLFIARASLRYRGLPTVVGATSLVGAHGIAKSDVDPSGIVHVGGEDWTALSDGGPIRQGDPVTVSKIDGIRVIVTRVADGKGGS